MIDTRQEKKLGRAFIETLLDLQSTPQDNVKRFSIAKRSMKRAGRRYQEYTDSETLLHSYRYYGFEDIPRRNGKEN